MRRPLSEKEVRKKQNIDKNRGRAVHLWLIYHYGHAKECAHCEKKGEYYKIKTGLKWNLDWALIHGRTYEKNIKYFMGLCKRCHQRYDVPTPTLCKTRMCGKKHYAMGYCKSHYDRDYNKRVRMPRIKKQKKLFVKP